MADLVDQRGFYPSIIRTPQGTFRPDKSGYGLLVFEQNCPGEGREEERLPINRILVDFALLNARDDFPLGTTALCPDVGQVGSVMVGSVWRYPGQLPWVPDQAFWLVLLQGSNAVPVTNITGEGFVTGFNRFGSAFTPPFPFFPVTRRLEISGDIVCPNADVNGHTQLRLGGVTILDAQWTPTTIGQHFEVVVWVSGPTQVTTSVKIVYVLGTDPDNIVDTSSDYVIPNLNVSAQTLELGIYNAQVAPAGNYKLTNFGARVTA